MLGIRANRDRSALEQMRDSPAKGHVLVSDEPITINGNPGREYVIVRADNYTFVVRTTLVGHRFYQLIFKARGLVEPDSPDVKRFLDSFALDQAPWDRTR